MVENVVWSPQAVYNYNGILLYLLENWSFTVAENYQQVVYNLIDTIVSNPDIGMKSVRYVDLCRILITKHSFLIYRISGNTLEIVDIFDTRQDPDIMIF